LYFIDVQPAMKHSFVVCIGKL